jgi:hypothetical protein
MAHSELVTYLSGVSDKASALRRAPNRAVNSCKAPGEVGSAWVTEFRRSDDGR